MFTTISRRNVRFWLAAVAIVALALGISAGRSAQAAAVQANLQRSRAADQARLEAMAGLYSVVDSPVSGARFDTEQLPAISVQTGRGASISGVRGLPHPGLYRLIAVAAPTMGARGMPHPGLYKLLIGS